MKEKSKEQKATPLPYTLLDSEGYPTEEYLNFIKEYTPETMPIIDFIQILQCGWYHRDWGFRFHRKYRGIRRLELHTGGWSGNEDVISAIKSNVHLTSYKMRFVKWIVGGHYYFEISI